MVSTVNQLSLVPLGAGDLIDRAVRLYRLHFFPLMRIVAPPVLVAAVGSVLWTVGARNVFKTPNSTELVFYILLVVAGVTLIVGGHILSMLVMGGATRNLVTHLLWNESVSARATYFAVRARFWSLLGATLIVVLWGGLSVSIAFFGWYLFVIIVTVGAVFLAQIAPVWLSAFVGVVGFIAATVVALWLFFFLVGRAVYVPQVLLVEGKGVFESIGRSFSLDRGNIRRHMT